MQSSERATLSRLAAIAALLAMPGLAMGAQQATEFDIKAYDFDVLTTGHFPRPAESVDADEEYYLQCLFGVAGQSGTVRTQVARMPLSEVPNHSGEMVTVGPNFQVSIVCGGIVGGTITLPALTEWFEIEPEEGLLVSQDRRSISGTWRTQDSQTGIYHETQYTVTRVE